MNLNQEQVPSIFRGPDIGGTLDQKTKHSPIEFRQTFVNNLGVPVTLYWRNGMKFVLPPEPSTRCSSLIVRVHILVRPAGYRSVANFLATVDDRSSAELKVIREAFRGKAEVNFYRGGEIVLDYPVSLRELQDLGGAVYYSEVDTVVALDSVKDLICHPHSEEGRAHDIAAGVPVQKDEKGFTYFVRLVDNAKLHGPRFVNIGGKVYPIKPTTDIRKKDGIYIVSNHSVSGNPREDGLETRYYPFGDAEEKVGLWKTYEEAVDGGDPAISARKELAAMEETNKKLALEKQEMEQRNAMQMAEIQREANERAAAFEKEKLRLERERAEAEYREKQRRASLTDYYEQRSHERKDYSEGLKFLPTLLIGLGALAGFILQARK